MWHEIRDVQIRVAAEKLFWMERGQFERMRGRNPLDMTLREVDELHKRREEADIFAQRVAGGDQTVIDTIYAKRDEMIMRAALADARFINGDLPLD